MLSRQPAKHSEEEQFGKNVDMIGSMMLPHCGMRVYLDFWINMPSKYYVRKRKHPQLIQSFQTCFFFKDLRAEQSSLSLLVMRALLTSVVHWI